jgi:hypothetical protein
MMYHITYLEQMVLPLASMAHGPRKEGDDIFIYYFYLQPQRIIHLCIFTW